MSAREDPEIFLNGLRSRAPELQDIIERLRVQHSRKLWHQLTGTLFQFLDAPSSKDYQVELFEKFVRPIAPKLNQLRFAELAVKVSQQLSDPARHVQFLVDTVSQLPKDEHPQAHARVLSTVAHAKLLYGDLEGTKTDLDVCSELLDNFDGVEPSVHAAFYSVASDFYKAKADYAPYYKHSLLYLACVNPETDMSPEERVNRAHDLSISALLGATIYNFGELLMHPILDSLENTPHSWLKNLLFVFNEGNIGKFESLAPLFPKEPILQENHPFLRQKICLMALMEAVFKRATNKRTMSFQEIAEETKLPIDEVEHLLMKALSLKLIRGSMDQVDQRAHITWVQPRVLSVEQISQLAGRLTAWCDKLSAVETSVKHASPELLVR
ncbi:hypothetical protein EXIGLDRAFT_844109 [Exidia glandulosa HHB12029]|uniref:PCI domain-containing protein n=1 Tax=Exidia glandulosa HHB12029 TaxID=1314781 RepID=A0A165C8I5_EXIGL|nr:hypothetical protein EXIGLDRAFT_844109 [Exidia glandulosa HHB12029]